MALTWVEYNSLTAWEIFDNALNTDTPQEILEVMEKMCDYLRGCFEETEFFEDNKAFIAAFEEFENRLLEVMKTNSGERTKSYWVRLIEKLPNHPLNPRNINGGASQTDR